MIKNNTSGRFTRNNLNLKETACLKIISFHSIKQKHSYYFHLKIHKRKIINVIFSTSQASLVNQKRIFNIFVMKLSCRKRRHFSILRLFIQLSKNEQSLHEHMNMILVKR